MGSGTLEKEYCPPLDPALFSAITSDFDFSDAAALASARETLDALKTSAIEQELSGFDPSGNSGHVADAEDNGSSEGEDSSSDPSKTKSEVTDLSALSNDLSSLEIGNIAGSTSTERNGSMQDGDSGMLDPATKVLLLQEMFPTASEYSVSHTLAKCDGNWNRALEELLNHAFFNDEQSQNEDDRISAKGVDAFSEDGGMYRGRKRKDRKKPRFTDNIYDNSRSDSSPATPRTSTWDKGRQDVEFIATRTNASVQTISSLYHRNSASLPATIIALIEAPPKTSGQSTPLSAEDTIIQLHASELQTDFPTITPTQAVGLILLTHPSTSSAHELARALNTSPTRAGLDVTPTYVPLNISDSEDAPRTRTTRSDITTTHSTADYNALASTHHASATRSFAQASAAYRRGKSDHLMSAAAGYYSQVGRDHASARADATAGAADALVTANSSPGTLDLHGVSVKDAVRIARERTAVWYRGSHQRVMGLDGRMRNDDGGGGTFTIVTGVGRHSEGGRGKLGPAVGRMLLGEGWHVSFGEGVLVVEGRKR